MESVTWYDGKRTLRSKDMPLEFLSKDKDIVLLLQGGGALGAYQVGAFKALATACAWAKNRIAWVAGISIGAINAAVIAGPKNEGAVEELQSLWNDILSPEAPPFDYLAPIKEWFPKVEESWFVGLDGRYLDWMWLFFNPWGHAHFFSSRLANPLLNPWLQQWVRKLGCDELGFYGTQRLTDTLNKHVNWEGLEDRKSTLLSLGATRVCDGEVKFFHSWETKLEADHVRASGALPPAFPPVQIGPDWYFDGGVSTNTPIEALARDLRHQKKNTLVFLVDLWDRKNDIFPESLDDVIWRQKCIQYGSRKKAAEIVLERYERWAQRNKGPHHRLEVCQVMLEHKDEDHLFAFSDADFTRETFRKLSSQGFDDMTKMLQSLNDPQPAIDDDGHRIGGRHAYLYRCGSEDKWMRPKDQHHHKFSRRSKYPILEAGIEYWRQFAPNMH